MHTPHGSIPWSLRAKGTHVAPGANGNPNPQSYESDARDGNKTRGLCATPRSTPFSSEMEPPDGDCGVKCPACDAVPCWADMQRCAGCDVRVCEGCYWGHECRLCVQWPSDGKCADCSEVCTIMTAFVCTCGRQTCGDCVDMQTQLCKRCHGVYLGELKCCECETQMQPHQENCCRECERWFCEGCFVGTHKVCKP